MGSFWLSLLLVLHILVGCAVIGFVLLQHGKGADMGAAFGSGASGSLFGATGSANFLSRSTAVLATIFFITSLALSYFASGFDWRGPSDLMESVAPTQAPVTIEASAPAASQEIPK
ncbi:MAG: preprotein translocase subunit SecG [Candidatus Dactylopiibacterium carminicum]|uniref:Protein-export membrane protein SecG n=1 Tax=Candidatus Dactylopiibacterium carminicum TaxID=857335 RepID=A0A272EQ04_9RHOO|nr:preprotein translocase subunit SecG [Candidatus Dactylopiibacterium carminicum]KAF7598429.1 preprotein translocase subunit SecG [Candidatus Dactylopiibacterium carminicum]PAS92178.1 MAG: preprotein translocase subunit SecG [Candidatus Dactylopiibacterium carminicum]PAS97663.1 MAG: preprotein translocase subunit SecG [Candidatus Dactylopiibacterium carminicum]